VRRNLPRMRRLFPTLLLLLVTAAPAAAQSLPILTQNPPALRWQEIRSARPVG
jgi:hypothetical protein